jgi:hypothetical protein
VRKHSYPITVVLKVITPRLPSKTDVYSFFSFNVEVMRAPVHDDGQIEAVFARLAKPVTAPGGAWVSQFSAVSEGVRRAISSSPQRVICFAPLLEGHLS